MNMLNTFNYLVRSTLVVLIHLSIFTTVRGDEAPCTDPIVGWRQFQDPYLDLPEMEIAWPDSIQAPWLECLQIEESGLRREAADAITTAMKLGMVPRQDYEHALRAIVANTDEFAATRLSAAQALINCNFRDSAEFLASILDQSPLTMRLLVEPALAEWDYTPYREKWLARLQSDRSNDQLFHIAIQSLGQVHEQLAVPELMKIAESPGHKSSTRLIAASALTQFNTIPVTGETIVRLSSQLKDRSSKPRPVDHLVGVRMLERASSTEAITLLEGYADTDWNIVRADALRMLTTVAPDRVVARAENNIRHPDANVRKATVDALATDNSLDSIGLLSVCLNDRVPQVRQAAREYLLAFAQDEQLKQPVIERVIGVLDGDVWQGIEQALLILTQLEQSQIQDKLFALLAHPRDEILVTACWSIKELADESWGPRCFGALQELFERLKQSPSYQLSYATTHMVETVGVLKYRDAKEWMTQFIPKESPFHHRLRCAAIWSLGHLLDGDIDENIANQLVGRLNDVASIPSEFFDVRAISAVALGQMESKTHLDTLRRWSKVERLDDLVGSRCAWAVSRITGEPMPEIVGSETVIGGWFVEPLPK